MRVFYVYNGWESFVSVGESVFAQLAAAAMIAGWVWLRRRRRQWRHKVEEAIAERVADSLVLDGIPLRMKVAIYHRMNAATAQAARSGGRVAALRAEKAINNTIAWLLTMYHDAGWLGRLRLAIWFSFLFKVCLAHQMASLERRTAPELADLLLVR
jgi:hypothetical protein